ncbi:MAG TPA: cysteine rich repeat-containing protein [Bradyrhizobium sp.]
MIKIFKRTAALSAPLATILFGLTMPVFSQAPTDAQRNAIRSECRSDYEAHCASVPPGGAASLQCLQKNISSLSPGCQTAVRAVEAPVAPKAESIPAAAPAQPAAESTPPPAAKAVASTTAKKPSSAQIAAIRSACRSDYQKVCAGVPTGGSAALQCLEKYKSKVSAPCQQAVGAASGGAAASAAGGAATAAPATAAPAGAPAAAPAPALVLRPLRPREEIFVLRSACGGDVRALCGGVQAGGGRIAQCLATQAASLSPACKEVLSQFAAR